MERWFLMDNDSVLDSCLAYSMDDAWDIFLNTGWMIGDVISEGDYMAEMQLRALEQQ